MIHLTSFNWVVHKYFFFIYSLSFTFRLDFNEFSIKKSINKVVAIIVITIVIVVIMVVMIIIIIIIIIITKK